MKAKDILSLIPDKLFDDLSATTDVDYKVKKLNGRVVFTLLMYSLLTQREPTLRVIEQVFNSFKFKRLAGLDDEQSVRHSSISERITNIDYRYFEAIYRHCVSHYKSNLPKSSKLIRFDSTLVSLSCKLIDIGFRSGGCQEKVKQLKFTVGYSDVPEIANFYHEPRFNSENVALFDTIMEHDTEVGQIILVDGGLQARNAFDAMTDNGKLFITKTVPKYASKPYQEHEIPVSSRTDIKIIKDHTVWLFNRRPKRSKHPYRIIHALVKNQTEEIAFLTNNHELKAIEVADLYQKRWDIEVFFKFLKHELNLKHFLNRSINGIQVILYTILTLSVLVYQYKKANNLGSKVAKLRLAFEFEEELIKHIVILSGGDPNKINPKEHFF